MARDDSELDQETYQRVLAEETAKGTDRRIAEGRARSAAVKAYRKAHGIESKPPRPAGAVAPAAAAASGNGGGDGAAAPVPVAAGVGAAASGAAALRTAPAPTGRPPSAARPGAPDKQRL